MTLPKLHKSDCDTVDSVPQNFIPGYTKPVIHHSPESGKKNLKTNLCYKGVPVSFPKHVSDKNRNVAIGTVGLQAIAFAAPSEHSDCHLICDGRSSPIHLFPAKPKTNMRKMRSTTYSTSDEFESNLNESTLLPYKIIKKEMSDKKKWRSLENLHKVNQTTKL